MGFDFDDVLKTVGTIAAVWLGNAYLPSMFGYEGTLMSNIFGGGESAIGSVVDDPFDWSFGATDFFKPEALGSGLSLIPEGSNLGLSPELVALGSGDVGSLVNLGTSEASKGFFDQLLTSIASPQGVMGGMTGLATLGSTMMAAEEGEDTRKHQSEEAERGREHSTAEREKDREWQEEQQEKQREWEAMMRRIAEESKAALAKQQALYAALAKRLGGAANQALAASAAGRGGSGSGGKTMSQSTAGIGQAIIPR